MISMKRSSGRPHGAARLVAAVALLAASSGPASAEAETRMFVLADRALSIEAPLEAELVVVGLTARLELRPGARTPKTIVIALDPADAQAPAPEGALSAYTDYSYETALLPGGSGGDEAVLEGQWAFGGRRYRVTCRTQIEGATRDDATWCLPHLRSLREVSEPIEETGAPAKE